MMNQRMKSTRLFSEHVAPDVTRRPLLHPSWLLGGGMAALSTLLRKTEDSTHSVSNTATLLSKVTSTVSVPLLIVSAAIVLMQTFGVQTLQAMAAVVRHSGTWYFSQLNTFPLITKAVTSGVIGVIGDYFAQWLEYRLRRKRTDAYAGINNSNMLNIHGTYDMRRGLAILVDGMFISGPIMHWGYDCMERILPISQGRSLAALIHVIADSLVLDSIFVGTAIVGTGLMEGYRFRRDIVPQLKRDYANALKAGWATSATLMPLEFVCFRFLPVTLRTVAMNLTDVIWNGIISFMAHRGRHEDKLAAILLAQGEL